MILLYSFFLSNFFFLEISRIRLNFVPLSLQHNSHATFFSPLKTPQTPHSSLSDSLSLTCTSTSNDTMVGIRHWRHWVRCNGNCGGWSASDDVRLSCDGWSVFELQWPWVMDRGETTAKGGGLWPLQIF